MRTSVIIPSFRSSATIRDCLTTVLAQDLGDPFEVLVADSGGDGTAEIVSREFPGVRLLKSGTRMSAELARNWGARQATGSVLAFIDSDCLADRDWLRRLCVTIEGGAYDGVGGAIGNANGANAASWAGYFCEFREFLPGGPAIDATYLTPGNVAYRRETFEKTGGFPDGYFPLEDQIFYTRLRAAGARIRFDPSIVVRHVHRSEVTTFLAHQAKIGAANARVVRTLDLQGAGIASHPWLAAALLPVLATYRFGRTMAACWTQERFLMLRRPAVAGLCWLGMFGWGVGFAQGSAAEARLRRANANAAQ
jgi:glycosyltransferase involved in cell wall biosynthesis